jgi:hypothetical protein
MNTLARLLMTHDHCIDISNAREEAEEKGDWAQADSLRADYIDMLIALSDIVTLYREELEGAENTQKHKTLRSDRKNAPSHTSSWYTD